MMIKSMIEQQVVYAAQAGEGGIIEAPFRNFTPKPSLLQNYLKNLIGAAVGKPEVDSGIKQSGAALTLQFPVTAKPSIGLRIAVSIPRDKPLSITELKFWYPVDGVAVNQTFKILPATQEKLCHFTVFSGKNIDTEIYPLLAVGFVGGADPDVPVNLTINDGQIPDGANVAIWNLNLSDTELRNYVNSLD